MSTLPGTPAGGDISQVWVTFGDCKSEKAKSDLDLSRRSVQVVDFVARPVTSVINCTATANLAEHRASYQTVEDSCSPTEIDHLFSMDFSFLEL